MAPDCRVRGVHGGRRGMEARIPATAAGAATHLDADRGRLRWIHSTMVVAMILTPAGLGGIAAGSGHPAVWAAAVACALGSVFWVMQLTFRLTVQERVAARVAGGGDVPDWFALLESWVGLGHRIHMLASYASAIALTYGLAESDAIAEWLAWAGAIWERHGSPGTCYRGSGSPSSLRSGRMCSPSPLGLQVSSHRCGRTATWRHGCSTRCV